MFENAGCVVSSALSWFRDDVFNSVTMGTGNDLCN